MAQYVFNTGVSLLHIILLIQRTFGEFIYTYSYNLVEKIVKTERLTKTEKLQYDVLLHHIKIYCFNDSTFNTNLPLKTL